ncbi:MAG TPA: glycosyltransferase family 4 protein [Candidatus Paceibacterota bacterium]|nr:glycosyltransferase family 4 protein [Candidatus Paceibacterota bacterium]
MKKRLLIITQSVDADGGVLEFFIDWIRGLAAEFSRVDVITLSAGRHELPPNVHVYSLGKERKVPRVARWIRLAFLLAWRVPQADTVFAHMSPAFALAAWPVTFVTGRRLVLWYLHRSRTMRLRLAARLADAVVTANVDSLTLRTAKVIAIGHGIPVDKFSSVRDGTLHSPVRILTVGRITPIKNLETLIAAAARAIHRGTRVRIKIIGQPAMAGDSDYLKRLKNLVSEHKLAAEVEFAGYVAHERLPEEYRQADVYVGLTPAGGIDKTLLEAMASGCIVLTSNAIMKEYFGPYADQLIFAYGDSDDLARKLESVIGLSDGMRTEISRFLGLSVRNHHDLNKFIKRLTEILYGAY